MEKIQTFINLGVVKARLFMADQRGLAAIEYALIAALVAVVIVASVTGVGTQLVVKFNALKAALGG